MSHPPLNYNKNTSCQLGLSCFQGYLKDVKWVFEGSFQGVSRMFQQSFKGVSRKIESSESPSIQVSSKVYVKEVQRVFKGSFKDTTILTLSPRDPPSG